MRSHIFDRIVKNPEITEEHISYIYNLDGTFCRQRNSFHYNKGEQCRDNPNCFEGLKPKRSKNSSSFGGHSRGKSGSNKEDDYTRSEDGYCGLKNLGATCYMNSLLQCLYFTPNFRDAVYNWTTEEETKNDQILQELKILFAYLQMGTMKYFVPTELAYKLELKTAVQQDVQEFYQLLIFQYLENCFKRSNKENLKTIIEDLFVAKGIYKTTCQKCKNSSETKAEWNLLSLSIEDSYNLESCLNKYLRDEHLDGYKCEHCNEPTQVIRSTKIDSLPPILNIQLLRFVYDKILGTKKKLSNNISFNEELDLGWYLTDNYNACPYKLYAVICHIGTSASAGHYIAYIRDSSNQWWKFDDTYITRSYSTDFLYCRDNNTPYILLYKKKNFIQDPPLKIPENIEKEVFKYNDQAMGEAIQQQQIKFLEKENKDNLRKKYKEIKKVIHANSSEYYWISFNWIKKWFNQDPDLGPIDNSELQCAHNAVHPEVTKMKRISKEAWDSLYKTYGGGPVFTGENNCIICVTNKFDQMRQTKLETDEKSEMSSLCFSSYSSYFYKNGYYVSKPWFDEWRMKKIEEVKNLSKNFTYGIVCEHGSLVPESSKYTLVPEKVFEYLKKNFPGDIVELPYESNVCPECKEKKEKESKEIQEQKMIRDREKTNLNSLYYLSIKKDSSLSMYGTSTYYIINTTWFNQWCSYVNHYWEPKPGVIDNSSLICQQHQLLNCDIIQELTGDFSRLPFILVQDHLYKQVVDRYGEPFPVIQLSGVKYSYSEGITEGTLSPPVCFECASSLKQKKLEEAKNFKDQSLQVIHYRKKEEVIASCTTTVSELKLLIFEKFEIEPRQQKLICDNVHLSNSALPLSNYGVTPFKTISVENYSGGCEPMDEVYEKPDDKEFGFAGTNLTEKVLEKRPEKQEEQPCDIQEEKHPEKKPKTTPKEDPPLQWPHCKNCTFLNTDPYHIQNKICEICNSPN